MSKKANTILLAFVFLIGLAICAYPTVANYINSRSQTEIIQTYNEEAERITAERYQEMIDAAKKHNELIAQYGALHTLTEEEMEDYLALLNLNDLGVIGYIEIPKIDVALSIGHTVEEKVLLTMVGHIPGSSLPVEGESVHAVLSAHRGLPSAVLFSDLDRMEIGDSFTIHILDRIYQYVVDDIKTILPEEVEQLNIVPGENYVTLMTCTPYGVNTHRLLVRGRLTEASGEEQTAAPAAVQGGLAGWVQAHSEEALLVAVVSLLTLFVIVLLIRRGKRKK